MGAASRLHPHHIVGVSLVLRDARGAHVVGQPVGRSHDDIGHRHTSGREGRATAEELASMADAWRTWSAAPDGWFTVLHGEIVCTAP
jgi:hypothetical protein